MSSKYSEYLNLYLYLQIWKSTCTWLKYFEKYLTPTLIWTNDGMFYWRTYVSLGINGLIGPLGIHLSEIRIRIQWNVYKKMNLKISSTKWQLLWLSLRCRLSANQIPATKLVRERFGEEHMQDIFIFGIFNTAYV